MLMVTIVVITLNCLITEEVRVSRSQRTISTCVMYYSKFEQELSAFSKALIEWSLTRTEKQRKKPPLVIHKSGRGRLRGRSLRELFITEFK